MPPLPPWPLVQSLLVSLLLPSFVAGGVLMAGIGRVTPSARARMAGTALALAAGLAAGNFFRELLPWGSLEPGWSSLFPASLLTLGGGVFALLFSARAGGRWELPIRVGTAALGAAWLTPGGPILMRLGTVLLLAAVTVLNWEALHRLGNKGVPPSPLLALVIPWGGAAAGVLIYAHSARFSDLAVLMTSSLCGVGAVAILRKLDLMGVCGAPALFFPALLLGGATNTFSEVPNASFALVALAPCALLLLRVPPLRHWSGSTHPAAPVVALLVPCAVAIVLAMRAESLDFGG